MSCVVLCTKHIGVPAADTPPPGWPGDLARAEPLSEADAKEAADLSGLLEDYLIRRGLPDLETHSV